MLKEYWPMNSFIPVFANPDVELQFLLAVSKQFGDHYLTHVMLPVFLLAVGDNTDLTYIPPSIQLTLKGTIFFLLLSPFFSSCSFFIIYLFLLELLRVNIKLQLIFICCSTAELRPKTVIAERLSTMCVLPLLLAGVLGAPSKKEQLAEYLRKMLVQNTVKEGQSMKCNVATIDAVRFLWSVF